MSEVEDFIYRYEDDQREVMLYLHELLLDLNLTAKIQYKIPFYYGKSWICYLNPGKKGEIEFAFPRGSELSNSQGLLESKGRKLVRSMELRTLTDIPGEAVYEILQEAILLDETVPYRWFKKNE